MASGQELMLELSDKVCLLDKSLRELGNRGRVRAKAEYEYRVALRETILKERDKGTPTTIISDVCRGDRNIAKLKFDRDVADTAYEAAKEAIQVYKIQIRVLENTIEREYRG